MKPLDLDAIEALMPGRVLQMGPETHGCFEVPWPTATVEEVVVKVYSEWDGGRIKGQLTERSAPEIDVPALVAHIRAMEAAARDVLHECDAGTYSDSRDVTKLDALRALVGAK